MELMKNTSLRLHLGLATALLLLLSFTGKAESTRSSFFLAAICSGMLWWVVVIYMHLKKRELERNRSFQGDVLDLDDSIERKGR